MIALAGFPDKFHNARLVIDKNLPVFGDIIEKVMTWDDRNRLKHYGSAKVGVKVNSKTGLVTGSLRDGSANEKFGGVILQKQNLVKGHHNGNGIFTMETR